MQLQTVSLKAGVWGAVVGSVLTMILGFGWGGWTTNSTAQQVAARQADAAGTGAPGPACGAGGAGRGRGHRCARADMCRGREGRWCPRKARRAHGHHVVL